MNKNLIKEIGETCANFDDGEHFLSLSLSTYSILIASINNEEEDLCSSSLAKFLFE